ncbi:MAG: hypothetical protein WC637_20375 [Victivallales bacterium]
MEKTEHRMNGDAGRPYLSQNNFNDWLKNPDLVRMWHHERDMMPKPSPELQKLFDFGHLMHEKAHGLYPSGFEETRKLSYKGHLENSIKLLQRRIPLFELGFQYDNLYSRPDIMIPAEEDSWDMIEVKAAPKVYEDFVKQVAFMYHVIVKCGVKINKCYLMHLKKGVYARPEMPAQDIFEKTDVTGKVLVSQEFIRNSVDSIRMELEIG